MAYPFEYVNAFFIKIDISRLSKLPREKEFQIETKISISKNDFPEKIQVNFILKTPDTSPLKVFMEMVGVYKYIGSDPNTDQDIIAEFVFQVVVPSLYPAFLPVMRSTAALMGVHGINFPIPGNFTYTLIDDKEQKIAHSEG